LTGRIYFRASPNRPPLWGLASAGAPIRAAYQQGGVRTGHGWRAEEASCARGMLAEPMRTFKLTVAAALAVAACVVTPAVASADPAICHNGVLSDDAGQGCADGLYAQVYGSGTSDPAICHDGILSNDAGQGCTDGLYGHVSSASHRVYMPTRSSGGSSNSMVNPNCESSGNSQIWDPSGTYWGKYQFDRQTWVAHGGSPGAYGNASEAEQDRVASRVTYDAWPNC